MAPSWPPKEHACMHHLLVATSGLILEFIFILRFFLGLRNNTNTVISVLRDSLKHSILIAATDPSHLSLYRFLTLIKAQLTAR